MGKALYRKYRSKSLAEIIGQEHITKTLDKALKQSLISHAYLFTGPRGTGKTSVARILAHEVNKLPYSEQPHLDIIEIDAASNRRIDEIRELKERVHIAPTSAAYKVYIIDEVHMLTKEAFNALLKTLEEPPKHVIFILATTEAHKVPETIISRTQRFTFKPVPIEKVVKHLLHIAKQEGIKIDTDALQLIAAIGEGSFRDSISLLDQVRHLGDHITLENVEQAIGQAPAALLSQLLDAVQSQNLPRIASSLAALTDYGVQPSQVAKQIAASLRQDIVNLTHRLPLHKSLQLLTNLTGVSVAPDPGLKLEIVLYGSALSDMGTVGSHQQAAVAPKTVPQASKPLLPPKPKHRQVAEKIAKQPLLSPSVDKLSLDNETWPSVLAAIKAKHNTLYSITRMAVPNFVDGTLILSFAFAFHKKRLEDNKNKQLLTQIIEEVTGRQVIIEFVLDPDRKLEPPAAVIEDRVKPVEALNIEAISNIFGGAEVVE